jgi:hypothetical protein
MVGGGVRARRCCRGVGCRWRVGGLSLKAEAGKKVALESHQRIGRARGRRRQRFDKDRSGIRTCRIRSNQCRYIILVRSAVDGAIQLAISRNENVTSNRLTKTNVQLRFYAPSQSRNQPCGHPSTHASTLPQNMHKPIDSHFPAFRPRGSCVANEERD